MFFLIVLFSSYLLNALSMVQITGDHTVANVKVLVPLLYITPLFIFYFLILFIITCSESRKQFSSSFFTFFKIGVVCNIGSEIFIYLFLRTSQAPFFLPIYRNAPESSFIITIIPLLSYYFPMESRITDAILALNRFSIFVLKNNYKSFWKKCGPVLLLLILIFPGMINLHFYFTVMVHNCWFVK